MLNSPPRAIANLLPLFAALFCGAVSGLEEIHSVVDRLLELNGVRFVHEENSAKSKDLVLKKKDAERPTYALQASADASFFPGRRADVLLNGVVIGVFGVLHPEVLAAFGIPNPCAALELNVQALLPLHVK